MWFTNLGVCRIHAWGGLGSQLHAVALYLDLIEKFPQKRFNLVFHTGGVTRRSLEVHSLFPELVWQIQDDFVHQDDEKSATFTNRFSQYLNAKILFLAIVFGIFSRSNSDQEYKSLKRRIRVIRGHYSYRTLTLETVLKIEERLKNKYIKSFPFEQDSLAIHYRMGDLLNIKEKNPITERRVGQEIAHVLDCFSISKIIIYSDSPDLVADVLKPFTKDVPTEVRDCSAVQILAEAHLSTYFIGTSSKISFWSIFFRNHTNEKCHSSIPHGNSINLIRRFGAENQYVDLREY
jgi:hypothetical protein